jgi:ABC-type Fe2+-enterobactin transport system substrate-binding protein
MNANLNQRRWVAALTLTGAMAIIAGCQSMAPMMAGQEIMLSGANEVPAVVTSASGTGTVTINADRTVSAKITVTGMTATASHIHEGAAGANGPVIVPFTKTGELPIGDFLGLPR